MYHPGDPGDKRSTKRSLSFLRTVKYCALRQGHSLGMSVLGEKLFGEQGEQRDTELLVPLKREVLTGLQSFSRRKQGEKWSCVSHKH